MTIKHIRKNISAENVTTLFDIQIERDSSDNLTGIILTRKNFYNDKTAKNVPDSQENLLDYFYTKNEVNERIKIHMIVCDELPEKGQGNYIYLVPFENEGDHNEGLFKEYIWAEVDNGVYDYEEVGSTELDLQPILDRIDALELEKISKTSTDRGFLKSNGDIDNSGTLMTQSERDDLYDTHQTVSLLIGDDGAAIINDNDAGEYTNLGLTGSTPISQDSINRVINETFGLLANVAWTGSYNDLTNKPTIPTKTSQLTNDSNFLTQHQDISGKVDKVSGKGLSTNDFTDSYKNEIDNLSNNYQSKGNYLTEHQDISGKANTSDLATVATTGSYNDLDDKPNIPTDTNDLTNNAGYVTLDEVSDGVDLSNYYTKTEVQNGYVAKENGKGLFSGSYNDLTNKPTNISSFTNDIGYLTSHQDISGKANISDLAEVAISGNYNDLNNTPSIINNLTSDSTSSVLSAKQGKELKTLIDEKQPIGNYLTEHQDISGKANAADLSDIATSGSYTDLDGITTQQLSITYDVDGTDVTEIITFLTVQRTNS